jgi:hypothetical protein
MLLGEAAENSRIMHDMLCMIIINYINYIIVPTQPIATMPPAPCMACCAPRELQELLQSLIRCGLLHGRHYALFRRRHLLSMIVEWSKLLQM